MAKENGQPALKKAEAAFRETLERYRILFDNSRDAVVISTPKGEFVEVNRATLDLLGYSRNELLSSNAEIIYADPEDRQRFIQKIEKGGFVQDYEVRLKKKDGSIIDCLYTFSVRRNEDGTVMEYQGIIRDVTERNQMIRDLQTLSLVDDLTGIYNRRGFFYLANQQFKTARRMNLGLLCIFIDIDGFKYINDTFGHPEGDRALRDTAHILKDTFRDSDIIGRLGGDEFAILVLDDKGRGSAPVVGRLKERIVQNNESSVRPYYISVSVGVYRHQPQTNESIEEMVEKADALMYEHKKSKPPGAT